MDMEKLVALCRRRVHLPIQRDLRGINGFWTTPAWRRAEAKHQGSLCRHVATASGPVPGNHMVVVDCSIIMNPKVWERESTVAGLRI